MKMIVDILEAVAFIAILSIVVKLSSGFIGDNKTISLIIVIVVLILWIFLKIALKKYLARKNNP